MTKDVLVSVTGTQFFAGNVLSEKRKTLYPL